jgi:hypothetical protein
MAPKPGYEVPFDIRTDELIILTADAADNDASVNGVINLEVWNIGGTAFKTETCVMTLVDTDSDTYWDSFSISAGDTDCLTYGGKTGLIQYILSTSTYTNLVFDDGIAGEDWKLATFDEMYDTVDNGGVFWWDDEPKTVWTLGFLGGAS